MADEGREVLVRPAPTAEETAIARRVFSASRYFAVFAVLGAFLASVTLYIYGALVVIQLIWETLTEYRVSVEGVKHLQVVFIEMTDVFLLGTVLFIVSFGLFQLFVQPDLPVPPWLRIDHLDQLTERLVEVVGVLLSVTFLAYATESLSGASLIELGVTVAVVISALSLLLLVTRRNPSGRTNTRHD